MLPTNRRQQIRDYLNEHGAVQIGALSAKFAVSEMTIHRDLAQLEAEGHLRKVRGGAVPVTPPSPANAEACFMCQSTPRSQTQMTLHLTGGAVQRACCPHCGLYGLRTFGEQITAVFVTDFLRGNTISAQAAAYVVNPAITICCKPSIIAFQKREDAVRFQRGFGGDVLNFVAAVQSLQPLLRS